ncbi:hypothetical protein F2Q68_00026426, partial [Brassica cretica]
LFLDPIDGWIHLGHSLPSRSLENLVILVTSLPRSSVANSQIVMLVIKSTRPRFRNNSDKVAFVVHATFVVSGYKLVAIGRHALAKDALASSPTRDEVGIEGWKDSDEVKRYAAKSREEGDYYDAQFNNLDRLVTNSKRNREPEPVHYARRPFPLGPQFHQPSVVDRPDYSNLIPGPPGGSFPVVRDGFGGGSMLVRPDDLRMFLRVVDQIQPGFMGSPQ